MQLLFDRLQCVQAKERFIQNIPKFAFKRLKATHWYEVCHPKDVFFWGGKVLSVKTGRHICIPIAMCVNSPPIYGILVLVRTDVAQTLDLSTELHRRILDGVKRGLQMLRGWIRWLDY